jgi:hypothetical protein
MSEFKGLDQVFGIKGSERNSELSALDKMFGIEGTRSAENASLREMEVGETIGGEVVGRQMNEHGHESYIIDADNGEKVKVPVEGIEMENGENVDVTRQADGYEVDWGRDYGR